MCVFKKATFTKYSLDSFECVKNDLLAQGIYHRIAKAIVYNPPVKIRGEGRNMKESFLLKGFRNAYIIENDPYKATELLTVTREIDYFPEEDEIVDFMKQNQLDRCEIVKSYKR